MSLKKVTSTNTSGIKQIVLKDIIVDNDDRPIALEDMFSYAEDGGICYIDSQGEGQGVCFGIDDLPYCCGLYEIGNLYAISFMSQKAFNIMIKGLLMSKLTFIVNTNGEKASQTWDEKLAKSKMFTCVKEFINPNSKNNIKVWVSNHLK